MKYIENEEELYKYELLDNEGKVVYSEKELYKEPIIKKLSAGIIKVIIPAGTAVSQARYYAPQKNNISSIHYTPWDEREDKLIKLEKNKLIVTDIFDKSKYYKEIKLNTTDTADPNSAIKSAEFIDDNTIRVIYFTGTDYKEVTEIFHLNS